MKGYDMGLNYIIQGQQYDLRAEITYHISDIASS